MTGQWRKSGPAVPVLCVLCFLPLVVVSVIAPLVSAGIIPFAVTP